MGAYIINVPSTVDRIIYVNVDPMNGKTYIASYSVDDLTPYTGPDFEQVRKEGYEKGWKDGKIEGRAEVWVVARNIDHMSDDDIKACFECGFSEVFEKYTASEAIEKIRQYEQEKDRQARIEYNFDEIKDVLETTAKECNVSLDEIAEVLQKMKETDNG